MRSAWNEGAAFFVTSVIPHVPVRQWVLSFPTPPLPDLNEEPDLLDAITGASTIAGFSLHAGTYIPEDNCDQLEALCRYLLRPPVSEKRLKPMPLNFLHPHHFLINV